jgi:glutathionylspermidine synthase
MVVAGGADRGRRSSPEADQFNSLHEKLIDRFRAIFAPRSYVHFASDADHPEDRQTVRYLEDLAGQADLLPKFVAIDRIGLDADGRFVDQHGVIVTAIFKLYPWEDMFREPYAPGLMASGAMFIEPPWKAILSNKAMLPLLWERHPGHPNLLPAFFDGDPRAAELGSSYVRKPFFSREGWDLELVDGGVREEGPRGGYGEEGPHPAGACPALPPRRQLRRAGQLGGGHRGRGSFGARGYQPHHAQRLALPAARDPGLKPIN